MWKSADFRKYEFYELWKTVEAKFYNIKSRLYLGLFSVKTLLQPSFALAAMTFPNVGYVIMTVRFLKLYELWKTMEAKFYNIKS